LVYKENGRVDLHIHSTASDGTLSPSEILFLAKKLNLSAISITDHDTIDGVKEAFRAGIPPSIKLLTGVEVSTAAPSFFPGSGSLHILGYGVQLDHVELIETLEVLQHARDHRNPRIIERLNSLGIDVSLNDVIVDAGKCQLGRPHIAQYMLKKGFVQSIDEAFDKYLGKGKPAYVDKYRVDPAKAIEIIRQAGGIPVLAHPCLIKTTGDQSLEKLVQELKKIGLMGLEAYYPDHSAKQVIRYTRMARRFGMLITGGTDFHGSIKPDIQMGFGKGDFFVPYLVYEKLARALHLD
jgi:predicted metal-dependent phosphoesterase TrpH